ncbi:hypothetical protein LAZ67_X003588, partial [Cordylochernes scorpioides]
MGFTLGSAATRASCFSIMESRVLPIFNPVQVLEDSPVTEAEECADATQGLYARRPIICVPLTPPQKRARELWRRQHVAWNPDEWSHVIFTDESRFSLNSYYRCVFVWREVETRNNPRNMVEIDPYRSQCFMVWAGIYLGGHTALHIFRQGTLTGQRYRDEILAAYVMPQSLEMVENLLIMDDNARPHRVDVVDTFLRNHAVLCWIKSESKHWKPFVGNRIAEIQRLTLQSSWYYVSTKDNPADCASRGITSSELVNHSLWWNGPDWLSNSSLQDPLPITYELPKEVCHEKRKTVPIVHFTTCPILDFIFKFSTFRKLSRVTAWLLRFIHNARHSSDKIKHKELSSNELNNSIRTLIQIIQSSEFKTEIQCCNQSKVLPSNSKLLSLNPFIDSSGILRVGGRLRKSNLQFNEKHPIILPHNHFVTELIVQQFHVEHLHSGLQLTLCAIRQKYWIPSGRILVKKLINRCMTCFKTKRQVSKQIMGDLPIHRIIPSSPFSKTGIDFAGPFITKPNVIRTKVTLKSYIALFICFSTKAIHLEIVSDLSTPAFLAAFRRFISRRGKPSDIFTDNATNFKGAKNILNNIHQLVKDSSIQSYVANEHITWHFIPPSAPNFGGIWEAGIKSLKYHLLSTPISTVSMPRRKIRAHYEHMSEFETGRAIGLKEAGWSNRLIARHLCRSDAAIRRCWQKWVNNGSGRPRATTEREDRAIVRMAVAAPESTLSTIQRVTGTQVSKMTINRRLRERKLRARRPLRCLPLTPVHRQVRLQWCRERSTWNCADWGRIVFSDESRFLLCPDDRRKRVWRCPGQRVDPGLTVEHHTGPQQGVMVWGAISFDSRIPLVVIPGTLTAQRYVDDILWPVLLPFLSHHPGLTFQQDNARPHTASVTMDCLQSCRTLPWPARSPDFSPIEHIWDVMGRRLQPSRNVDYLARQLETIWQEIPQHTIRNIYHSMTRRVADSIQA